MNELYAQILEATESNERKNGGNLNSLKINILLIFYYSIFQFLPRNTSPLGAIAGGLRGFVARRCFEYVGEGFRIERKATFGRGGNVRIGDQSNIGYKCEIHGIVHIGNFVMMGPESMIMTTNHRFSDPNLPMIFQGETEPQPVIIGNDVWIGARTIILPGVTIGDGTVIGAGSVVSSNIPAYVVAAGVPCKVLKSRK